MIVFSGIPVELTEIENHLKTRIQIRQICQEILYQKIINQAAEQRNLTVTEAEIEAEAQRQRREMRLEKASDTFAWLAEQMITPDEWETGIYARLLRQKLAETLFSQAADKFFAQNRLNFDQVLLYQIIVPYEQLAWELFYQIEEEEISFYHAAHLYDIEQERRNNCGYEGKLYRWSIKPELAAVIFAAKPKQLISPVRTDQGYHILLVEKFIPAELTPENYQEILNKMFEDWLTNELIHRIYNFRENPNTSQPD